MFIRSIAIALCLVHSAPAFAASGISENRERKLNNLVTTLLDVESVSNSPKSYPFTRSTDGWIVIAASGRGTGPAHVAMDEVFLELPTPGPAKVGRTLREGMRFVPKGDHTIAVRREGGFAVETLAIKAIPELIHCGLGFNSEIKSYGVYDLDFLQADILPNVTTLIVPNNLKLADPVIERWHRQGKRFVAEVGINSQAKSEEEHRQYWTGFLDRARFLDGIIVNEFIVNRPVAEWVDVITPERRARMTEEQRQYQLYGDAIQHWRADVRYRDKVFHAYIGGSGKKLNREIIGTNFIRTIVNAGHRVALERYLHEMSSEQGARDALQLFVEGVADWKAQEPDLASHLIIVFGLFSMPPGSINKQPNVDYHVWMDQQMHVVANHPVMAGLAGLEWWTSSLADEETVRFVGRLYRHYAIDGNTNRMTSDPLFLSHLENPDFVNGTNGWTLRPAEEGAIAVKSHPRYGRIEGRYMGLGRPADPEHIGDTFLWMKRSARAPNTFSQTIKNLEPGRRYSLKMLSCDYADLVTPKVRKIDESRTTATVTLQGVELDAKRSFVEVYASSPEPKIPMCITYHWKVFRATSGTATLTVSDWEGEAGTKFGQEQTFNFLELQPYWE